MKPRLPILIALLLVLPLVLAACGGGPASNAEKFIEAIDDNDKEEAEKYVCDKNKDELTAGIGENEDDDLDDISCEEDGDDVKCTIKGTDGERELEAVVVFGMEDDKVCEIKSYEEQ